MDSFSRFKALSSPVQATDTHGLDPIAPVHTMFRFGYTSQHTVGNEGLISL